MKTYNLFYIFFLISLTSCKKFLEKKSDSSLVVPQELMDYQKLLDDANIMNYNTPCYGEASSDDYYLLESTFNGLVIQEQQAYTWIPYDYYAVNDWSYAYNVVYNANLCLDGLENIDKTFANSMQWSNVKGAALFFRAYSFLNLAWVYSKAYDSQTADKDLGIVIRLNSDFNQPSVRVSVKDTYQQIVNDAKEAAHLLPDNPDHVIRPSKAAAYGLLARAYLSMHLYDSALLYSNLCLQIKSSIISYNNGAEVNIGSNVPFRQFNPETIFYSEMNGTLLNRHPANAKIDTTLYEEYLPDDLRKEAFFRTSGGGYRFKGSYAGSISILFTGISTDEVLLTRAECYARINMIPEAMADINLLLSNRWRDSFSYIPISFSTQENAIATILLERRKELLMRGIRWSDIKRLNQEGANIILKRNVNGTTYELLPNSPFYALPLPSDIIQLTGIPQN